MSGANPARGEAAFRVGGVDLVLRPSFEALVAAEEELGPLLPLVERAAAGELRLAETASLIWHCVKDRPAQLTRERVGAALAERGLAAAALDLRGGGGRDGRPRRRNRRGDQRQGRHERRRHTAAPL